MLELRLRRCNGDAFQDFFSTVMEAAHDGDFVRIRPHGKHGDGGCDGYLQSTGEVFACYGTINGTTPALAELLGKINGDGAKAKAKLGDILKRWTFVHNFIGGVPTKALQEVTALGNNLLKVPVGFFGLQRFAQVVFSMADEDIAALLGDTITEANASHLDYKELRALVGQLATGSLLPSSGLAAITPVSSRKLQHNNLSAAWRELVLTGLRNSKEVESYLAAQPDAMAATKVAECLRAKYLDLSSQGLSPTEILENLSEFILGSGPWSGARFAAGLAVIGYFFETCCILEDSPSLAP
jgi:hypothetical protein